MEFKELLRTRRREMNFTQRNLADRVNAIMKLEGAGRLVQSTISAWESGRQSPSTARSAHLVVIADVLKIDRSVFESSLAERAVVPTRANISENESMIANSLIIENPIVSAEEIMTTAKLVEGLGKPLRLRTILGLLALVRST